MANNDWMESKWTALEIRSAAQLLTICQIAYKNRITNIMELLYSAHRSQALSSIPTSQMSEVVREAMLLFGIRTLPLPLWGQ